MSTTILFFDDWYLAQRVSVDRHVGKPRTAGRFVDPYADVSFAYPSVFRDQDSGLWRCLYQGFLYGPYIHEDDVVTEGNKLNYRSIPLMIESDDALNWRIPDLTDTVPLPDRRTPHQVLPLARLREWGPPFYDARAEDPAERIKAFVSFGKDQLEPIAPLWVSPDGIRWRQPEGAAWHPVGIDPSITAYWNPIRKSYVLVARPAWGDRRMAVYETTDWRTYSKPELALQADALDTPMAEIYGMPSFPYEDMFVGFVWLFHPDQALISRPGKGYLGTNDCQLAYSWNGWHYQRGLREPFVPRSEPGEDGAAVLYPTSLVRDGDVLRICSASSRHEHGQGLGTPENPTSALLFQELRLDGFVYLESSGGWGSVATRIMYANGPELSLNVLAPHGVVQAQVMDDSGEPIEGYSYEDCLPFTGDDVRWAPEWRNGRRFGGIGRRVVRLGIRMLNARLYAVRGDFHPIASLDKSLFDERGIEPPPVSSYWS